MSNKCSGHTCPISMNLIPEEFAYKMNKQTYNVRALAKMILFERQHNRVPTIPHTRDPLLPIRQSEILRRAGMPEPPLMRLHDAVMDGRVDVVRQHLVARTPLEGHDNETPLMLAAERGYEKIVKLLLDHGANIHAKSVNPGDTALDYAIKGRKFDIVKFLIARGADVNAHSSKGVTTLMGACGYRNRDPKIVKYLIRHGADVRAKDRNGHTALWYAQNSQAPRGREREAIIEVLRHAGLNE